MNHHYLHFTAILIIISFFLFSCKPDDVIPKEEEEEVKIITDVRSISFERTKDASLVVINSKKKWTASSDADWISFTATSGEGKTGFLIGASENKTFPRIATVTLSADTAKHKISVTQAGATTVDLIVNNITLRMILLEAGKYKMGDVNVPYQAHDVEVDSFYICETEVTNGLWLAIKGNLPYDFLSKYDGKDFRSKPNEPVSAVTWNNVTDDFLPALKAKTNLTFRLPTEAEWEYAALGGKKSKGYIYAGSNTLANVGWFSDNSGNAKKNVKQKAPNELFLYDMSGNVSEWCSDWHGEYSGAYSTDNPKGPDTGQYRVIRGGSYQTFINFMGFSYCGTKSRYYFTPTEQGETLGFRFVISF